MKTKSILIALSLMSLNAQAQWYNYDVNKDGDVNVTDVTFLVNKILGEENPPPQLTFSVDQKPYVYVDGPASTRRKTPVTTIESLNEFYLNSTYELEPGYGLYSAPELRTYWAVDEGTGQGKWLVGDETTPGNGYWPNISEDNWDIRDVSFYAYANVNISNSSSDQNVMFFCDGYKNTNRDVSMPYIHFIMDENGPETKDLLVAKKADNWQNCKGHIFFHFEHACAAAQFFLVKTSKLANVDVMVKKAVLYNVMNDGKYFFNSDMNSPGSWSGVKHHDEDNRVKYTLWDGSGYTAVPAYTNNTSEMWQLTSSTNPNSDYYFFIPQEFTPWDKSPISTNPSGSYIELECQITPKDNSKSFGGKAYIPFTTANTLQSGYAYPIIVKIGTGLLDADGQKIFNSDGTIK